MTALHYLGRGVTSATILHDAADQGRRLGAPGDMIARFEGAAAAYVATGEYPRWAEPVQLEKRSTYVVAIEREEAGT